MCDSLRMNRYVTCMHLWLLRPGKLWPCGVKMWTWMTMTHCCGLPNLRCRISLLEDWNFQSEQLAQRRERCEWSSLQYLSILSLSATFFFNIKKLVVDSRMEMLQEMYGMWSDEQRAGVVLWMKQQIAQNDFNCTMRPSPDLRLREKWVQLAIYEKIGWIHSWSSRKKVISGKRVQMR